MKAIVCNTSVPANDPYIFTFPSSSTFLFSCQLTFKLVTSHISDLIFMSFFFQIISIFLPLPFPPCFAPNICPCPCPLFFPYISGQNRGQGQRAKPQTNIFPNLSCSPDLGQVLQHWCHLVYCQIELTFLPCRFYK